LVEESELEELDTKLEPVKALRLVVASEPYALSRQGGIIDCGTPYKASIDTAVYISLIRKVQRVKHTAVCGMRQSSRLYAEEETHARLVAPNATHMSRRSGIRAFGERRDA
jgi:hypothetical protein